MADGSVKYTRRQILKYAVRGLVFLGAAKGVYNTTGSQVVLTQVDVRIKNLPSSFNGFTIGQLSDLHSSFIVSKGLLTSAAELLMSAKPDIIALTGDFISGSTKFLSTSIGEFDRSKVDKCVEALSTLKASYGIYGVLGNHDFWSGDRAIEAITSEFEKELGIKWLRNSSVKISKNNDSINLIGVDDYWQASCSLSKACKRLDRSSVRILLSHNPDINNDIDLFKERIDLVLSGHTHGGQVVAPLIGQPVMPSKFGQKYRIGLVKDNERQTFITSGVGHLLAPIRFNCPPEAAIIRLVAA